MAKIWVDGKLVPGQKARVHVLSHSLQYGTAVFEGIRCYKTGRGPAVFRLDEHCRRLVRSSQVIGMTIPWPVQRIAEAVKETVRANRCADCYIRPIIYFEDVGFGMDTRGYKTHLAIALIQQKPYFDDKPDSAGLRCRISNWKRIDARSVPLEAKVSGYYVNSVLGKLEALNSGYDECIMLNYEGHVSEGSAENIFVVKGKRVLTPSLRCGILPGITRDCVMHIAHDLGYKVEEKEMKPDELHSADEVFMTGTAAEVVHVSEIDGRRIRDGKAGPVTQGIAREFEKIVRGESARYARWLTLVK
jgi:branched-chain amino acid aminotransferase